jgi:hypothetical protein
VTAPRLGIVWPIYPKLGQAAPENLRIFVTDIRGLPFEDASVFVDGSPVRTDTEGNVAIPLEGLPRRSHEIVVEANGIRASKSISDNEARSGNTVFFQLPVRSPEPLLKTTEAVEALIGVALAGVGFGADLRPLQILGEVVFGAAAFTVVYRQVC